MWYDNETDCDFVNFESIAKTVGEIIVQSKGKPVSIGVSGAWGMGKSSMIKLISKNLTARNSEPASFIFVEFNAWLYQGYDDARAALLDVIAQTLESEAKNNAGAKEKVYTFLKKVDWLRVAGIGMQAALFASLGLPPSGIVGQGVGFFKNLFVGKQDQDTADDLADEAKELAEKAKGLLKKEEPIRPPHEIQALRDSFEDALKALNKTLVVFIDDLDRCLPNTTISTLEAIRLFLFLERTAFIIAADSHVIRHAVRKHFEDTGDSKLVTSYFDKLIQVPIQVPPLGTQEVRAYLILLHVYRFVENSMVCEKVRRAVCEQLSKSWEGRRIDQKFVEDFNGVLPDDVVTLIKSATRLAHLLTTATDIAGNPRLIKRFLNALAIRQAIANAQGIDIDPQALAKILLLERCGSQAAYKQLVSAISGGENGKPEFLKDWEDKASNGEEIALPTEWNSDFIKEWLELPPSLSEMDLRREIYVSRESTSIISPQDRMSAEAAELLAILIDHPQEAPSTLDNLKNLPKNDMNIVYEKLLEIASRESQWGTPDILEPLLTCIEADPSQSARLADFLKSRKIQQIDTALVARIRDYEWAKPVLSLWESSSEISGPIKKAIAAPQNNFASQHSVKRNIPPGEY